jgi:integrase
MATFRQRTTDSGQRRWQAIVRRHGAPDSVATFSTKRAAERWAAITEGKIAEHRHLLGLEAERHTVNDLLNRFTPELNAERRKFIAGQIKWWREAIGDKPLSEVTPALLRQQLDRLLTEPYSRALPRKAQPLSGVKRRAKNAPTYQRSVATVNRHRALIARALSVAHRQYQWIAYNPATSVPNFKEPRGRVRILTNDERRALLDACAAQSADLHALVMLALCSGGRAGELVNLRWPDVDIERKRAVAHRTKNGERRSLPLFGPALALLKEREKARRTDTELVFAHPGLDKPYDYAKPFGAALTAAGIENFRFHDLRHTAASALAMSGATTAELAGILGHKTLSMVRRYSHLTDQHVSDVVERMVEKNFGPQP